MTRALTAAAALLCLAAAPALAQRTPLYQVGTINARDAVKFSTNGLIERAGGLAGDANGRGINPHSITDSTALGLCSNTAATTGAYNAVCIGHDTPTGNGLITLDSYNGGDIKAFKVRINGVYYDFPGSGLGNVVGPTPDPTATDLVAWNGGLNVKDSEILVNAYKGLTITQSATGTLAASTPLVLNKIRVTSDDAAISGALGRFPHVSGPFHNAVSIEHNFGGANMTGGVNSLVVDAIFTGATSAANANRNYAALAGIATAEAGDGGTNTLGWAEPGADSKGGFFGLWAYALARPAVQNITALQGVEINVAAEAGATGWLKEGAFIGPESADVASFTHNILLSLGGKSATATFDAGISFNNYHGSVPIKPTGSLMTVEGHSATPMVVQVAHGFDLRRVDIIDKLLYWCMDTETPFGDPLACNGTGWLSARKSQMYLLHNHATAAGGEPTYTGDVRLIGTSQATGDTLANGGIEFKISEGAAGYGFRLFPLNAAGATAWIFQRRFNSAAWTDSFRVDGAGSFQVHDPAVFDSSATFDAAAVFDGTAVFNTAASFTSTVGFTGATVDFSAGTTVGFAGPVGFNNPVTFTDAVAAGPYIDMTGVAAPGAPGAGTWRIYVDVADGILKAKHATGTVIDLATP